MLSNYTTAAFSQTTCDRDWQQAHDPPIKEVRRNPTKSGNAS